MGNTQPKMNRKPCSNDDQQDQEMNTAAFFICEICTEQVPLQQSFKNKQQNSTKPKHTNKKRSEFASSTPQCAHPFCTDCIAKYIQVMLEENDKPDIICPDMYCANVLDPLSCCSFLPPKVFVRWCDYLCRSTVCERYDTAYCPNPYCSELVLNECNKRRLRRQRHLFWRRWLTRNKQKMISKCPHCKLLFCLRCMVLCQANHQCSNGIGGGISRTVKRANEAMFMQMVASKKWKRCPTCKIYIDRYEGCPHIECRCGTEFCYECGKTEYLCVCYQTIRTVVRGRGEDHQRAVRVPCFVRPLILTLKSLLKTHDARLPCSSKV